jgi:hypothetical protein
MFPYAQCSRIQLESIKAQKKERDWELFDIEIEGWDQYLVRKQKHEFNQASTRDWRGITGKWERHSKWPKDEHGFPKSNQTTLTQLFAMADAIGMAKLAQHVRIQHQFDQVQKHNC